MDGINKRIHIILNLSPQTGWDLSGCNPYVSRLLEEYQKSGVYLKVTACREGEAPAVFDSAAPDAAAPDLTMPDAGSTRQTGGRGL